MSESKNSQECQVCLSETNNNKIVDCGYCEYKGCTSCTRRCILYQTTDPTCPACNHSWNMEFCMEYLGKTWMKKNYRDHKKNLLYDIEKSKIPNTMPAVERIIKIEDFKQKKIEEKKKIEELETEIFKARCRIGDIEHQLYDLKANKVKNTFVYKHKCPNEKCGGFLNEKFICPMCNVHVCKNCYEIKEIKEKLGESKNDKIEYNHTCNPNSIESFKLINKETRPCPQCSARIFKISGCDQMWCTQCHVTFSWTTGMKVTGNIHNPHYYEWKKNNTETASLRNVGEVLCGGLPNVNDLNILMNRIQNLTKMLTNDKMNWNYHNDLKSGFDYMITSPEIMCNPPLVYNFINTNCESKHEQHFIKELDNTPNIILFNNGWKSISDFTYLPIFSSKCLKTFTHYKNKSIAIGAIDWLKINTFPPQVKALYFSLIRQECFVDNLLKLHRSITHFQDYELHYLRIAVRDIDLRDEEMRIKYIMKDVDEKRYKSMIMKKHNKKQKLIKILHIFEMCNVTLLETFNDIVRIVFEISKEWENHGHIFRKLSEKERNNYREIYKDWCHDAIHNRKQKIIEYYDRINNIINYCNKELWKVSKLYNQNVPFINYGSLIHKSLVQLNEKEYETPGHLETIAMRWDSNLFQLYETDKKNSKIRIKKITDERQDNHFNSCHLFCNHDNYVEYKSNLWNRINGYAYSLLLGIKDIFDKDNNNDNIIVYKKKWLTDSHMRQYSNGRAVYV